jgi:hypothetical protein
MLRLEWKNEKLIVFCIFHVVLNWVKGILLDGDISPAQVKSLCVCNQRENEKAVWKLILVKFLSLFYVHM